MAGPTMQQVLDRAAEVYEKLPEDGKEVFYGRLVKEVDHTVERYAFFIPQTSVQPDEAVEKLSLTPPVKGEEVPPVAPGAVVGMTTTPDLPSYHEEEGVADLKGEAVEGTEEAGASESDSNSFPEVSEPETEGTTESETEVMPEPTEVTPDSQKPAPLP